MGKFVKGESGNPKGRPRGIPDKRTALKVLLEPYAEPLARKALELALAGDITALRLCFNILAPKVTSEPLDVEPSGDRDLQQVEELLKKYEQEC